MKHKIVILIALAFVAVACGKAATKTQKATPQGSGPVVQEPQPSSGTGPTPLPKEPRVRTSTRQDGTAFAEPYFDTLLQQPVAALPLDKDSLVWVPHSWARTSEFADPACTEPAYSEPIIAGCAAKEPPARVIVVEPTQQLNGIYGTVVLPDAYRAAGTSSALQVYARINGACQPRPIDPLGERIHQLAKVGALSAELSIARADWRASGTIGMLVAGTKPTTEPGDPVALAALRDETSQAPCIPNILYGTCDYPLTHRSFQAYATAACSGSPQHFVYADGTKTGARFFFDNDDADTFVGTMGDEAEAYIVDATMTCQSLGRFRSISNVARLQKITPTLKRATSGEVETVSLEHDGSTARLGFFMGNERCSVFEAGGQLHCLAGGQTRYFNDAACTTGVASLTDGGKYSVELHACGAPPKIFPLSGTFTPVGQKLYVKGPSGTCVASGLSTTDSYVLTGSEVPLSSLPKI